MSDTQATGRPSWDDAGENDQPIFTPEQLRAIDAAVAECMGFNVVATEWLCMTGDGRPTEAYRIPDYNEPPWFLYMKGRPSRAETIRPVYVPKDGQWPPVQFKPVGEDEEIWFADVLVVPEHSTNHNDWARVEKWMVDNFDYNKAVHYINERDGLTSRYVENPMKRPLIFNSEHCPLPLRCLAFLSAMGKDVEGVLGDKRGRLAHHPRPEPAGDGAPEVPEIRERQRVK